MLLAIIVPMFAELRAPWPVLMIAVAVVAIGRHYPPVTPKTLADMTSRAASRIESARVMPCESRKR